MKLYNTMTRKKEVFKPVEEGKVRMYVCGPTVYGLIHIGNARTFLTFDVLRRYLEYKGFEVKYVQNITDVGHLTDVGEDKIMVGASKMGMNVFDFVDLMIDEYLKDIESLNIKRPTIMPRASQHIQDMIEVVKTLIDKGYAYVSDGFVYFDISKFKDYGKLSRQNPEDLRKKFKGEEHGKRKNKGDFALWIPCPKDYPMKWESPWGIGFPGWHIECSTMSSKYLGLPLDIHGGGKDLIFPHHENEIAQAEAATGKKFVNYWMHSEFVLINGEKMSKSLGNIIRAREAIEKYGWRTIRYFLMSTHYRRELNFTEKGIEDAKKAVERILDFVDRIENFEVSDEYNKDLYDEVNKLKEEFEMFMDDDLDVPSALRSFFKIINIVNKAMDENRFSMENKEEVINIIKDLDGVLGLKLLERKKIEIPEEALNLIKEREKLRKIKDFKKADEIRERLKEKYGIILEDTPQGTIWKKKE
ncbi:MAG: cysteine--tRNA ligase [Candidatus Aenigmarchaeota archaeon]|nr:cysteine--tRNA ligase [Candidatus Aenigmarchaeota archaeon]